MIPSYWNLRPPEHSLSFRGKWFDTGFQTGMTVTFRNTLRGMNRAVCKVLAARDNCNSFIEHNDMRERLGTLTIPGGTGKGLA